MVSAGPAAARKDLWRPAGARMAGPPPRGRDPRRADSVLGKRRSKALAFFRGSADAWDTIRTDMIGARTDLLALLDLLDDSWVVGDLGCGTGHLTEALAPCVGRVIGVDESGPMLGMAQERLKKFDNVDLRVGTIESLPIDDESPHTWG